MLLIQIEPFRILLLLIVWVLFLDLARLIMVNCLVLGALAWLKLWLFVLLLVLLINIVALIFRHFYHFFPNILDFNFVGLNLNLIIGSFYLVPTWLSIGLRLFELVDGWLIFQIFLNLL